VKLYRFGEDDILRSTIKATPLLQFKIYKGVVYTNLSNNEEIILQGVTPSEFVGCDIDGLDFSCAFNSQYFGVI
jgi:hypothetical protein